MSCYAARLVIVSPQRRLFPGWVFLLITQKGFFGVQLQVLERRTQAPDRVFSLFSCLSLNCSNLSSLHFLFKHAPPQPEILTFSHINHPVLISSASLRLWWNVLIRLCVSPPCWARFYWSDWGGLLLFFFFFSKIVSHVFEGISFSLSVQLCFTQLLNSNKPLKGGKYNGINLWTFQVKSEEEACVVGKVSFMDELQRSCFLGVWNCHINCD